MTDRPTTRRALLRLGCATLALPLMRPFPGWAAIEALPPVAVWKDAACGCCGEWVRHIRDAGFSVSVRDVADMDIVKQARQVPARLASCHTAVVKGYVLEGHVPAEDVKRLLIEQPLAKGLAVPGMPRSAPGMDQPGEPYEVVLFGTPGDDRIYARH